MMRAAISARATRIALAMSVAAPVSMIVAAFSRSFSVKRMDVVGLLATVVHQMKFSVYRHVALLNGTKTRAISRLRVPVAGGVVVVYQMAEEVRPSVLAQVLLGGHPRNVRRPGIRRQEAVIHNRSVDA